LLQQVEAVQIDCDVVHRVDRLSRSLLDFARLMAQVEQHGVSFVSVTQQFNTTTSFGRLTLKILLSLTHYAERAIMQSDSAEVAVWLAFPSVGYSA
jgi:site-specific DNA recombinase